MSGLLPADGPMSGRMASVVPTFRSVGVSCTVGSWLAGRHGVLWQQLCRAAVVVGEGCQRTRPHRGAEGAGLEACMYLCLTFDFVVCNSYNNP